MIPQITIDYRAISHARFYWRNQLGITSPTLPRHPTVNGARIPDEFCPAIGKLDRELMLTRVTRRGLLDKWEAVCVLQLRNNHALRFTGQKAKNKWKAYNRHIYMITNSSDMEQALRKAIVKELEDMINKEIDNAKDQLEKKLRSRVGEIACCILNNMTFQRFGSELRISIEFYGK